MKKKLILLSVLLILLLSGAAAFYILSAPPKEALTDEFKEEAVTRLLGRKANINPENVPTGDTEYEGENIYFKYPAKALIYTYRDSSKSANLEDFSFDVKTPKLVFNMQVLDNNSNLTTILDFPSVRLREQRSYEYKITDIKAGKNAGKAYYKAGSEPEKSGFFLANGKIYSISITGTNDEEVSKLFDKIISTLVLK